MRNVLTNKTVIETVKTRVLSLLNRRRGTWQGTMTDLLNAINQNRTIPEVWVGSPSSLRRVVDQVLPSIRREGYTVHFTRTPDQARRRVVSLTPTRTPSRVEKKNN